jgi:hypothetical protein
LLEVRTLRRRTPWIVALALMAALAALPAWSQEPSPEPARFLIETITVEGPKEAAANIVRLETLLRPGESYTEDQLRQAVYRVHRLPFVLDASFSLRKGSRRGAYELLIEVLPARWFFYDGSVRAYRFGEPLRLDPHAFTSTDERYSLSLGGLVGARLFVGRSGVLFAALDSEEGFQAGFTQYDLLHRGIIASAGFSTNVCCVREPLPLGLDPRFVTWDFSNSRRLSLNLTVPLGGRQSLQVAASERAGGAGTRAEILVDPAVLEGGLDNGRLSYRRAEAKWVYDTSDDPSFPTRGSTLAAGLEASRFVAQGLGLAPNGPPFRVEAAPAFRSQQMVVAASAVRYWSITARQTISGTVRLAAGRSEVSNLLVNDRVLSKLDFDYLAGSVRLQHSLTLKRSRGHSRLHDLRWETGLELGVERNTPAVGPSPLRRFAIETALVYRDRWGRVRLSLNYLNLGKILP